MTLTDANRLERAERMAWTARVPAVLPSLNVQLRLHWAQRGRRVRGVVGPLVMALRIAAPVASAPRRLVITRVAKRRLDEDNLAGAHKGLVDGIARAGLLWRSDHPRSGNIIEHRQALGPDSTVVELEEIGAQNSGGSALPRPARRDGR